MGFQQRNKILSIKSVGANLCKEHSHLTTQASVVGFRQLRVCVEQCFCGSLRLLKSFQILCHVGNFQIRQAVLIGAEKVTGATQPQIGICNLKAIGSAAHGF